MPTIKVVEHPDKFVEHSEYSIDDFDYIIELRHHPEEKITYEVLEKNTFMDNKDQMDMFGDGFNF